MYLITSHLAGPVRYLGLASICLVGFLGFGGFRLVSGAETSPDGRFVFHAFSDEEVVAGKPAFGILESESGELVSNPQEDLGDASRPSEVILWAPDSKSYAISSRVGTRHVDTFFYRWDGKSFIRATWNGDDELETRADQIVSDAIRKVPNANLERRGATISGDCTAERWLDPNRVIVRHTEERLVIVGEDPDGSESGEVRAVVRWDETKKRYLIERELPSYPTWPAEQEAQGFEVTQTDVPGANSNLREVSVAQAASKETKKFTADGWMTAPSVRSEANGWPQIELHSHGPEEFVWRKLYRVVDGAYRCVRIDEMTRLACQAPEGSPSVEVESGYKLYFIKSREPKNDGQDRVTAFNTEVFSPDRKWKIVISYSAENLQSISVVNAPGKGEAQVVYNFDSDTGYVNAVCGALWQPDSSAFAYHLSEGPRTASTHVFWLAEKGWKKVALPKIDYSAIEDKTQRWITQHEEPMWWNGNRDLVLRLYGTIGEFDYHAHARLRWSKQWKPVGCETSLLEGPVEE